MTEPIKTGLVAFGKASRVYHGPIITSVPELELTKVVERRREESRKRYPWVDIVRDTDTLLEDDDITLVVITTPNDTHYELAKKCLLAGKHVVVDKPFTTTSARARELIDLAAQQNRIINAFQNRRWDGDFQTVQKLVAGNQLGRIVEFETFYDRFRNYKRPDAWREKPGEGSGVFFDLGPHLIDQILVLFGPPEMVTADIRIQRDEAETDDHFDVILHYDRLKVRLKGGMLVRAQTPRFLIQGMKGTFVKYGMDPQENALIEGRTPDEPGWGVEPEEQWGTINTEIGDLHIVGRVESDTGNYTGYYQNIVDAIKGRSELAVTPDQMINTIRIIERAFQSNEEKRTVSFSE